MKNTFVKVSNTLVPAYDPDTEALKKVKTGSYLNVEWSRMRNSAFHRKFFALLNFAFEHWEPGKIEVDKGEIQPEKNFDTFRKNLIVLAGFYERHFKIDGSFRIEPKSISFAKMDEDEFSALYNAVINVILKRVLVNYDREELDRVINELIGYM